MNHQDIINRYLNNGLDISNITNLTTNLQSAKKTDLCFYKFGTKSEEAIKVFNMRAAESDAGIIITDFDQVAGDNIFSIPEEDFLKLKNELATSFYPIDERIKLIAITGTNGKSSSVDFIRQLINFNGQKAISFGTVGVFLPDDSIGEKCSLTTPDLVEFRKIINKYQDQADYFVFELSSHALDQDRLGNIKLFKAGFTNFTQDHLDYHKTEENYLNAKLKIISKLSSEKDFYISNNTQLRSRLKEVKFQNAQELVDEFFDNNLSLKFGFMKENFELCYSIVTSFLDVSKESIGKINAPSGRFEKVIDQDSKVIIVDYAHTPDALLKVVEQAKTEYPNFIIKTLFGCGGNRDRLKRELMGKAAMEKSDFLYITSDNPRNEDPEEIISDILKAGMTNYKKDLDRKSCLRLAISELKSNEVLLVCGKGHEDYQEIKGVRYPFSDQKIIKEVFNV